MFAIRKTPAEAPAPRVLPLLRARVDDAGAVAPLLVSRESEAALRLAGRAIIDSMKDVPSHQMVLSGIDAHGGLRVPREVEYGIVAIELGPKRAAILYDPREHQSVRRVIAQLRATLMADSYAIEQGELACTGDVIRALVENYRGKSQSVGAGASSSSQGKMLWEAWVNAAVRERATDLHVEVCGNQAFVRVRVDGDVTPLRDDASGVYTSAQAEMAISWAYNIASGKGQNSGTSFDRTGFLYTMISPREIDGKKIALRYQSARGWQGPKVTARLLNVDTNVPTKSFAQLGYESSQIELFRQATSLPSGLMAIAGVTGSGKTTTLKTLVETHPAIGNSAFYSIEDPVEYPLRGVHQISLQRDVSDGEEAERRYQEVITSLMRMDPDGVLMGELRDRPSAMAAQQIVETGHFAAGTLHAHLISGIVPRLANEQIGLSREILTAPKILSLLVYQALVPQLCQCAHRGVAYPRDAADASHVERVVNVLETRFGLGASRFRFRRKGGCEHCNHRGTVSQTVVAEMLLPDRQWLGLTRRQDDYGALQHFRSMSDGKFDSPNMDGKTVFEHALFKALNGDIDPRQCERFDSLERFEIVKPSARA